ncbi:hypothetical protein X946_5554 [Burkholderia sp. ABCPW 111]|nr:hypothetical protein X946_5554 [Burkholderia sp. ABCPW 111]
MTQNTCNIRIVVRQNYRLATLVRRETDETGSLTIQCVGKSYRPLVRVEK